MARTYEDGYEKGVKDGYSNARKSWNTGYAQGIIEGRAAALDESREPALRKALQAFHLMHHKNSYTFEKCWDEPCRSVRL